MQLHSTVSGYNDAAVRRQLSVGNRGYTRIPELFLPYTLCASLAMYLKSEEKLYNLEKTVYGQYAHDWGNRMICCLRYGPRITGHILFLQYLGMNNGVVRKRDPRRKRTNSWTICHTGLTCEILVVVM